jgi:hypothetical protein
MKRIHIPNMGPDESKIPISIAIGIRECKSCGSDRLTIITPLKNLDSIIVGNLLGHDASKRLMKGEQVAIEEYGIFLMYHSMATVMKISTPSVGIAFYLSKKDIKKLDDLQFQSLIFVPWLETEGEEWSIKWGAETYGGSPLNSEIILPSQVEESMKKLTACVNLSTGLGHPSDKEHANRKFSELRSAGITWEPDEIEKWAVRNGWRAADAEELSKLSAKYT